MFSITLFESKILNWEDLKVFDLTNFRSMFQNNYHIKKSFSEEQWIGDVVAHWGDVVAHWGDVVAHWGDVVAQY